MSLKALMTEPLMHFLAIGVLIFAIDRAVAPEQIDPRTIRVDAFVYEDIAKIFAAENDRLPNAKEMDELVDVWLINETLYREARELRLDHGDQMMRERLAQRMRLMLYSAIAVETPDDAVLSVWYEENQRRLAIPPTISLRILGTDAADRADAEAVAARANALAEADRPVRIPGIPAVSLDGRPRDQIVDLLGAEMVGSVEALDRNVWAAVPSFRGWQVALYRESTKAVQPAFEDVRDEVLALWREERRQAEARRALDALMESYPVERDPYDPGALAGSAELAQSAKAAQ